MHVARAASKSAEKPGPSSNRRRGARIALGPAVVTGFSVHVSRLVAGARRFRADRRGAVSVEYVVVLATTGMVVAFAIIGWGPALVQSFTFTRALIISPTP